MGIDSTQQPHKHDVSLQIPFFSVLQRNIRFVWVLSRTQQPHKHVFSFQSTIFLTFCNGIYDLIVYFWLNSHTNTITYLLHCETPFFLAFCNVIYDFCGYLHEFGQINCHTITIFHRKTPFFSVGIESDSTAKQTTIF